MRVSVALIALTAFAIFFVGCQSKQGDDQEHTAMLPPDITYEPPINLKFTQTTWGECTEAISGNYYGAACSDRRAISVILKKFIGENIYACINRGLTAQGGGAVKSLHIVHHGITGDAGHSPRSLHSVNRAIDIRSFEVKLADGSVKKLAYAGTTNRAFYTAFRKCWGEVINKVNGCPLYKGNPLLTGNIGWEDANHRGHMHLSIPECQGGKYLPTYYQR